MPHPAFPDLSWPVYLNHAAVGPMPRAVVDAMQRAVLLQATRGADAIGACLALTAEARAAAEAVLDAAPNTIGFLRSTGEAIAAVAHGLPWRAGDRIILFEGEFPSNILPWLDAARRYDLRVTWIPTSAFFGPSGDGLAQLEDALRDGAAMVAVSAVQFQTGLRMPVEAITALAHAAGARVLVDGIQAVGAVPCPVGSVDFLACGAHKWLMGPFGTAMLYARPEAWAALRPPIANWLSHEEPVRFLFGEPDQLRYDRPLLPGPARIEGGAQTFVGVAGLGAALRLAHDVTVSQSLNETHAEIDALIDRAEQALLRRGFTSARSPVPHQRSRILSVRPPPSGPDVPTLAARLAARGVSVATPDGWLRISPSWPNTEADIDALIDAVDAAMQPA